MGEQQNSEWHASVQDIAGKTVQIDLDGFDLKPAIEKGLEFIVDELRWFLKPLPLDILRIGQQSGMLLSGGCGYLVGIAGWLADSLNLPVEVADAPDLLVIKGIRDFLPRSDKFFNQILRRQPGSDNKDLVACRRGILESRLVGAENCHVPTI